MANLFKKFSEIDNYNNREFKRWISFEKVFEETKFVIMEKLDGCNFQIIVTPDDSKATFASRNEVIGNDLDGFSFYNMYSVIMEKYIDILNSFKELSLLNNCKYNIYGEAFGKGIQKRINYGDDKYFKIFDIAVDNKYISFEEMEDLLNDLGFLNFMIPVYKITNNFQECLDFDTNIPSLHSPTNDICEGVVIKPYSNKKIVKLHGEEGFEEIERFIWKIKNSSFKEKKERAEKPETDDILKEYPEIAKWKAEFETYITENRLLSVISKLGELNSMKQIGEYLKEFNIDAKKDFLNDNDDQDFSQPIHKLIYRDSQLLCRQLIIKYLNK